MMFLSPSWRGLRLIAIVAGMTLTSGCTTLGYYGQSIKGHLGVLAKAKPIDDIIADQRTPAALRATLTTVLEIRDFASDDLALPDNDSYRSYADIGRPYVVWNVFAAPELSLQPVEWCFLIVGCVHYRGYYERQDAQAFAADLRQQDRDVFVAGIPAYSTLGWFDDPVLNTMLAWDDIQLAGLIFHELAHQALFVKDDTAFNESFATTVEQVGVLRWLTAEKGADATGEYRQRLRRREQFEALIRDTRDELAALYESPLPNADKRQGKQRIFTQMRQRYERMKANWDGYSGYDHWFDSPLNNARFIAVSAYRQYVPAFLALLKEQGGDLERFYKAARKLSRQGHEQRQVELQRLGAEAPSLQSVVEMSGPAAGSSRR